MTPHIARFASEQREEPGDDLCEKTTLVGLELETNGRPTLVPPLSVAFVGTYPPRRCGIATFTRDLVAATTAANPNLKATTVAITEPEGRYDYPTEVRHEIRQRFRADYARTAERLNESGVQLVSIQHEYGIFGGDDGEFILDLLAALKMPSMATLHTVLRRPTDGQKRIIQQMARHCSQLVVMSRVAAELLIGTYGISEHQVRIIPHGMPEMGGREQKALKEKLGITGPMMLSFGLLGPNKGIEVAIRALPDVVAKFPDLVYYVVGATHPEIVRHHGEAYRLSLIAEAERLGVRDHVIFHDAFVSNPELFDFLKATDVFVSPYQNEAQVTSGALSYAMGAGASVVSTPYWHAQELLAEGRGRLFPFGDHEALAAVLISLFESDTERARARACALELTQSMSWPKIGETYVDLGQEVLDRPTARAKNVDHAPFPPLRLDHLARLTDDTGIIQHATHSVPSRKSGYCVDDNARALVVALRADRLGLDARAREWVTTYLSYLQFSQNAWGDFRNFMAYDRTFPAVGGSEDCLGRAIWALGTTIELAQDEGCRALAKEMLEQALHNCRELGPRGTAFTILGLTAALTANPAHESARRRLAKMSADLVDRYHAESAEDWRWFEPAMTYDNGVLALALLRAFMVTGDRACLEVGTEALEHLETTCFEGEQLQLVGNAGWFERGKTKATCDEQPVDAAALVMAFKAAFLATGDDHYLDRMRQAFDWFLGANRLAIPLYDSVTAGCRDGLGESAANLNQGAESTLSWLLALLEVTDLESVERRGPERRT